MVVSFDIQKSIDEYLVSKPSTSKERDYFHVSEICKSKREIYYSIKNKKTFETDARGRRIFDNGDSVHDRYYKYFAEMGILISAEIDAVKTDLIHGRLDAIITDKVKNYIVDIKSISQWSFQKLKDEPEHSHKIQLLFYMYYMNIPQGFVLYECKDNQTVKVFPLELTEDNKKIVEATLKELEELKNMIKEGIVPEDKPILLEEIQY